MTILTTLNINVGGTVVDLLRLSIACFKYWLVDVLRAVSFECRKVIGFASTTLYDWLTEKSRDTFSSHQK